MFQFLGYLYVLKLNHYFKILNDRLKYVNKSVNDANNQISIILNLFIF